MAWFESIIQLVLNLGLVLGWASGFPEASPDFPMQELDIYTVIETKCWFDDLSNKVEVPSDEP